VVGEAAWDGALHPICMGHQRARPIGEVEGVLGHVDMLQEQPAVSHVRSCHARLQVQPAVCHVRSCHTPAHRCSWPWPACAPHLPASHTLATFAVCCLQVQLAMARLRTSSACTPATPVCCLQVQLGLIDALQMLEGLGVELLPVQVRGPERMGQG